MSKDFCGNEWCAYNEEAQKRREIHLKITRYGGYDTWEEYIEKTTEALRRYYRLEKKCRK